MKKGRKKGHKPNKPKGRRKPKPLPQAKVRTARQPAEPSGGATPFGGSFDFTAAVEPTVDIITRARTELQGGRPNEALALCRQVLTADPANAVALNLAGVAAFQSGLPDEALDMLETALAFAPDNAEALANYGNVLGGVGRVADAEQAYDKAIAADPRYAEAVFNRAVLMEATGRHEQALAGYENTIAVAPMHTGARQGRGNALKALKRLNEAREAYEDALRREPGLAAARTNLAAVLQELGDFEGALEQCDKALATMPDLSEAHYNRGIALQELARYEEAIAEYETVLAAEPKHAAAALNIAYGLQQLNRLDAAGEAFERTLDIDPGFAKAQVNLADLRLQQGNSAEALRVCDAFLQGRPGSTDMLAMKALALSDAGDNAAASELIDFDRFVRTIRIDVPKEFEDLAAFNAALCSHVENHPTLSFAPQSHATRKGRHSGELLAEPKGPIAHLEAAILAAADAHRRDLGQDPDHPFLAAPPQEWTLSVWGVVMQSAGHQIPHIHPAAWLSGVYYASLPEVIGSGESDKAGWIEFGRPPEHFHNATEPPIRSVRPEPGLMVLFPSYFYHHTVPFDSQGTRVSIAFDLMPA